MRITNKLILFIILIVAVITRFYDLFNIPLSHDEISALLRTRFDTFSDLINLGVLTDTHPAGVQVFMYYWIQLFGSKEWIIKLPFLLMGIASIFYFYKLGKLWYNESIGLFGAAFMTGTQFMIIYSQMARPYISGLLITLLMVYYWSKMIKEPKINFVKNTILFVLFGSLSTYNHHFSLFFTGLILIVGIFYIPKEKIKIYILSGITIGLLYIPHLHIFFHQLGKGGIGEWLAPPSNDWLIQFIFYTFNFSYIVILVLISIILLGIKYRTPINKKQFLLFSVLFFTPFIVGFLYSKYVNPVIQFSVMIFSFPYLYFLIFGHIRNLKVTLNAIVVALILITTISTTIFHRKHYQLYYQDPIEHIVLDYLEISKSNNNLATIIHSDREKTNYYFSKYQINTTMNWVETHSNSQTMIELVKQLSKDHSKLYLGALSSIPPELIPIITDYFPKVEIQNNYAGATTFLFSKNGKSSNKLISLQNFETKKIPNWQEIPTSKLIDSVFYSKNCSFYLDSTIEWSPSFEKEVFSIIENENNFIDVSLKVKNMSDYGEGVLVASIDDENGSLFWGGAMFKNFQSNQINRNGWINVHLSLKLSDMNITNNAKLKVYIWNQSKLNYLVDDLKIELRKGNPFIYGLVEQF